MKMLAVAAAVMVAFLLAFAPPAAPALVEHTFLVSEVNLRHLGKDTPVILVNKQFPGPVIDVREGDRVVVHVVNKSPRGVTIHWHGIKQTLTCWADGPAMVTQCPISPNTTFTYRFHVKNQEGTLWWHAHIACLRATVHGAFVIRPKLGPASYPFPVLDKELPIIIGEWWETDFYQLEKKVAFNHDADYPLASVINGKLGDLYNSSGAAEENHVLEVEYGKTYLLRMVNAALYGEYSFKIAGHKFTVVSADASYTKPYTTDTILIAPGETLDVLMVADAPPGRYYMVAQALQPPKPDSQVPKSITRGVLQYTTSTNNMPSLGQSSDDNIIAMPEMPDQHDMMLSLCFRGNLTSLPHTSLPPVPSHVDENLFITLSLGMIFYNQTSSHNGDSGDEAIIVATMNDLAFQLPETVPVLEAHFYNKMDSVDIQQLPTRPRNMFNFTDTTLINPTPPLGGLVPTSKAVTVRRFRHNTTVEVVFQSTSVQQSDSNPMHLHGHNFFVLAQGFGNYDAERDVKRYNLVDPPFRNTVLVPSLGWVAIRFVADNPGVWLMHCHYEFHVVMGMAAVFIVEDGSTPDTSLPSLPADLPRCEHRKVCNTQSDIRWNATSYLEQETTTV